MADLAHTPVMLEEVLRHLLTDHSEPVLYDLTLGRGGHLRAFLERAGPRARAIGVDADPQAVAETRALLAPFGERALVVHGRMRKVGDLAAAGGWPRPTAVLFDLGLSSPQVDDPSRGFSYRQDGPLDMRFDPTQGPTAAELLLALPSRELAARIAELGDEPLADEIVRRIKRNLPVETTGKLAALVLEAYGERRDRVHPARRTFQALRILVNDELAAIEEAVWGAVELLEPRGRLVALSFHSGEDRAVKGTLNQAVRRGLLRRITRRPERPDEEEQLANQRARSAKLRAAERTTRPV